jgi:SAM-dependent methyltransferase
MPEEMRSVEFRLTNGTLLPFSDGEADALYCVSVLEHIPDWEWVIAEVARVLKPGGQFILTFDLDLLGNAELGPKQHRRLLGLLRQRFEWLYPDRTVHPADVLDSARGPYPFPRPHGLALGWFYAKQYLLKPLIGRKPMPFPGGLHLAIYGAVLRKRA